MFKYNSLRILIRNKGMTNFATWNSVLLPPSCWEGASAPLLLGDLSDDVFQRCVVLREIRHSLPVHQHMVASASEQTKFAEDGAHLLHP